MITILLFVLFAIAILLAVMWFSPAFKEMVVTKWGAFGAFLVGILAWIAAWFANAPPTLPPM
jgi:uncharacterized membrane protein